MSNNVKPWIKSFLEKLLKYKTPEYYLTGEKDPKRKEKDVITLNLVKKAVQVVKYIDEVKAFLVSDTEHTIPVYVTEGCQPEAESEGIRWQELNHSIIVLDTYHFTTSFQATGRIEVDKLRKYYKELSFPCSILCSEFSVLAPAMHIMGNPKDINLEKALFANIDPFQLYLKLSIKQFGVQSGYLPGYRNDSAQIKCYDAPLDEADVSNLTWVLSHTTPTTRIEAETLGGETQVADGDEENDNLQPGENTWTDFHSQYLTQHSQGETQHSNEMHDVDSDDGVYSTGGMRITEVSSHSSAPSLASETERDLKTTLKTGFSGRTQTSQGTDEIGQDLAMTQHSPLTLPSTESKSKIEEHQILLSSQSNQREKFSSSQSQIPGSTGSLASLDPTVSAVQENDENVQSQGLAYTYESITIDAVESVPPQRILTESEDESRSEVSHDGTQSGTFSYQDPLPPAQIVIINDNSSSNMVKLRKVRRNKRKKTSSKKEIPLSPIQEVEEVASKTNALPSIQEDLVAKDAIVENDLYGQALIGRKVGKIFKTGKAFEGQIKSQAKLLISGTILEFTSPYYSILFDNGAKQKVFHHELLQILQPDTTNFHHELSQVPQPADAPNPEEFPTIVPVTPISQQKATVPSSPAMKVSALNTIPKSLRPVEPMQKSLNEIFTPKDISIMKKLVADVPAHNPDIVMDLSADIDNELTQPQWPQHPFPVETNLKQAVGSPEEFLHLQSPKKKRRPASFDFRAEPPPLDEASNKEKKKKIPIPVDRLIGESTLPSLIPFAEMAMQTISKSKHTPSLSSILSVSTNLEGFTIEKVDTLIAEYYGAYDTSLNNNNGRKKRKVPSEFFEDRQEADFESIIFENIDTITEEYLSAVRGKKKRKWTGQSSDDNRGTEERGVFVPYDPNLTTRIAGPLFTDRKEKPRKDTPDWKASEVSSLIDCQTAMQSSLSVKDPIHEKTIPSIILNSSSRSRVANKKVPARSMAIPRSMIGNGTLESSPSRNRITALSSRKDGNSSSGNRAISESMHWHDPNSTIPDTTFQNSAVQVIIENSSSGNRPLPGSSSLQKSISPSKQIPLRKGDYNLQPAQSSSSKTTTRHIEKPGTASENFVSVQYVDNEYRGRGRKDYSTPFIQSNQQSNQRILPKEGYDTRSVALQLLNLLLVKKGKNALKPREDRNDESSSVQENNLKWLLGKGAY